MLYFVAEIYVCPVFLYAVRKRSDVEMCKIKKNVIARPDEAISFL